MRNDPPSPSLVLPTRVLAAVLAVAVCGAAASLTSPRSSLAAVAGVPSAAKAKSVTVTVGDFFFRAAKVRVSRGTTVHWTWVGMAGHNVTFTTLHRHSPTQVRGSYRLRFAKPGTYHYLCTIHGFTGTVVVT